MPRLFMRTIPLSFRGEEKSGLYAEAADYAD
jgi:hypothetical protein